MRAVHGEVPDRLGGGGIRVGRDGGDGAAGHGQAEPGGPGASSSLHGVRTTH